MKIRGERNWRNPLERVSQLSSQMSTVHEVYAYMSLKTGEKEDK